MDTPLHVISHIVSEFSPGGVFFLAEDIQIYHVHLVRVLRVAERDLKQTPETVNFRPENVTSGGPRGGRHVGQSVALVMLVFRSITPHSFG